MSSVIGTAVLNVDEDGNETVSLELGAEFMQKGLTERIGSLYLLVDAIYDLMDNDPEEDEEDESEEEDEDEDEDFSVEIYA